MNRAIVNYFQASVSTRSLDQLLVCLTQLQYVWIQHAVIAYLKLESYVQGVLVQEKTAGVAVLSLYILQFLFEKMHDKFLNNF